MEWEFPEPVVIQGLLVLSASIVASLTALVIALLVYPYQKSKDRDLEIHNEKRAVYREFMTVMNELFTATIARNKDLAKEKQMSLHSKASEMIFYADESVAPASMQYINAVQNYRAITFNERDKEQNSTEWKSRRREARSAVHKAREVAISAFRADLMQCSQADSARMVKAFFQSNEPLEAKE